jgi:Tol biopolymer transport system component
LCHWKERSGSCWIGERGGLHGPDFLIPDWSADGRVIYFNAIDSTGASGLYSVPAAGGTPREVVRFDDPSKSVLPQSLVVKDKVYFALAEYESDIWVMDLEW